MTEEIIQETDPVTETEQLTEEQIAEQKASDEKARTEAEEAERLEQEETEKKPWFKKRFDEITRQKYDEKQRADMAEARASDLEKRIKKLEGQTQEPEFKPTRPKPTRHEFESKIDDPDEAADAYIDALTDWKLEQNQAKSRARQQYEQETQKRNEEVQTFEQKRIATVNAGKQKYQDWEQVVFSIPGAIMHQHLASAVMELPEGPSVAYYLGKNLQDAERISKLSPYAMAAELGKIEAKLSQTEKKTTQAPPPLSTVKGSKSQATNEIDPDKDPTGWVKARNEGRI